jgi:energy-coupling factor transport system permease protein
VGLGFDRWQMHPIIRVISYLVVAAGLALGGRGGLVLGLAILVLSVLGGRSRDILAACRGVWGLRGLWCSILLIYLAFTPGTGIVTGWAVPSFEGLNEGLERVSALAVIVIYVGWLLRATPREALVGGLYAMACGCGVSRAGAARLAVRTALVLEAVPRVRETLVGSWARIGDRRNGEVSSGEVVPALSRLLTVVAQDGSWPAPATVRIACCGAPPHWQWLYPTVLAGLFAAVAR